jgi:two-component system, chemotaxis family, CheB/CheR fusion protein
VQLCCSLSAEQGQAADESVQRLTQELELTQERLRTTRQESELTNEELRASNEELQSINEEYQSTSEELETSKEELQSINEELQTVNSELKHKFEAVSRAHSDLQNLMAATDYGTLFLDSGLGIKRFSQRVTELFRITSGDEGRPITDFAHQLEYEDLVRDAQSVLAHLVPIEREIHSRKNRWYDVRLRPYRTIDDKIDGVVITFIDVTDRRNIEHALRESQELLRQDKHLIEISHDPIIVWDFDGGIREWNQGSQELYGYSRAEALGKNREELLATALPGLSFAELRQKLLEIGSWNGELRQRTRDGRELTVESRIVLETMVGQRMVLESARNITDRKLWEQRQQLLVRELTHRVKNTLAVVQAIAHQTLRHTSSNRDFVERFDGRLSALGRAHDLLVHSEWNGADLGALARDQLEPYTSGDPNRVRIEGQPVMLPTDLATPFGLVLHELATNAAKHGPLSRPGGKVEVSWTLGSQNNQRVLNLRWQEKGGPPAQPPGQTGLGTSLIDTVIPGATVSCDFHADGLVCSIEAALPEDAVKTVD